MGNFLLKEVFGQMFHDNENEFTLYEMHVRTEPFSLVMNGFMQRLRDSSLKHKSITICSIYIQRINS